MTVREDTRLLDEPMRAVTCSTCGARVGARKSSWDQTSIQWSGDALERCMERRARTPVDGPNGATFTGCSALRAAVREAAVCGELTVPED